MVKFYNRKIISLVLLVCMLIQICIPSLAIAEEIDYAGADLNNIYKIKNDTDITMVEDVELKCMHGKTQGEKCVDCGVLAHSSKNIPLVGCSEGFFTSVMPPEDADEEDLLLYNMKNIRLVCEHIVADGLYCEQCGTVVNIQPNDYIDCAIFDSCIHGKIYGEKCSECKELKIEQDDYELSAGEEWADPLVYPTEILIDGTFNLRIDYSQARPYFCPWCDYEFGGSNWYLNVHYHGYYNGKSCWAKPSNQIRLTGTCKNHSSKVIYVDGHVDQNWFSHQYWAPIHNYQDIGSSDESTLATCLAAGKTKVTTNKRCSICGAIKSEVQSTQTLNKLAHKYTSYAYANGNQHKATCIGVNTASHTDLLEHSFVQIGEDYYCEKHDDGCDAFKTTIHYDAYIKQDGEDVLLKRDISAKRVSNVQQENANVVIKVSNESVNNYPNEIKLDDTVYKPITEKQQTFSDNIKPGGVRLKVYYEVDENSMPKSNYTIEYYKQVADSNDYELADTETGEYVIGKTFEATLKVYDGYKLAENQEFNLVINADATQNILKIYYEFKNNANIDDFSVWVPEAIYIDINEDGNVLIKDNPAIINAAEKRSIAVTEIILRGINGWSFVDSVDELSAGKKQLNMTINGDFIKSSDNDAVVLLRPDNWIIAAGSNLPLNINAVAASQAQDIISAHVCTIDFLTDWATDDEPETVEYTILLRDSANGSIEEGAVRQLKTVNGQIPELPNCAADYKYKHAGWVVQDTGETVKAGDVLDKDVVLEPVYEVRGNIVTIYVFPDNSSNGTVSNESLSVVVGDTWGEVVKAYGLTATPYNDKYDLAGYTTELEDVLGYLEDDYVIQQEQVITACFKRAAGQYAVAVVAPTNGGTINNGVTKILTDAQGVLLNLPSVTADKYYELDRWINIADDSTVTAGQQLNDDISIRPIFKLKDSVVTIKFAADFDSYLSSSKSVYAEVGETWGDIEKPEAKAYSGYTFIGWYNGNNKLTADTKITSSFTATAKSSEDFTQYFRFENNDDGTLTLAGWNYATVGNLPSKAKNGVFATMAIPSEANGKTVTAIRYSAFGSTGGYADITADDMGFSITQLVIPDTVVTIGKEAFRRNQYIKGYTLPDGLKEIGEYAFAQTPITGMDIPSSVETIERYLFAECPNFTSVSVGATQLNNAGCEYMLYKTPITSFVIPEGSAKIPAGMFDSCKKLYSVTIPDTVEEIGDYAFGFTSKLTTIDLPTNLRIMDSAFSNSTGLKTIVIPGSVESFSSAFSGCTALTNVVIEEGVETIGFSAFNSCTGLKTGVTIPSSVKLIKGSAFSNCSNIFLEIPDTVETIEQMAFWNAYHIYYYGKAVDGANDNWGAKYRN